jgi:hypothetical protein
MAIAAPRKAWELTEDRMFYTHTHTLTLTQRKKKSF